MAFLTGKELRNRWIANAERLDKAGHFAKYSRKQHEEVLTKGFLGRYPPDQAIKIAKGQEERGYACRTSKFVDEMRLHFGLVGEEVRERLVEILDEIPPESYQPPRKLNEPPGCPFIFRSGVLGREVFFKFQIGGTPAKPLVIFWSCHPPLYGIEREEP